MNRKLLGQIVFIIYILLVVFQIKTTNFKSAYSFTPAQVDQQIQRMNMYPPAMARTGYVLETKKEIQIIRKLEDNFFTVIDPKEYFTNRLPYIFAPFILVGLYLFIINWRKRKVMFFGFLFTILLLTIIGPYAKYGPILMYFYFLLFVFLQAQKLFKRELI